MLPPTHILEGENDNEIIGKLFYSLLQMERQGDEGLFHYFFLWIMR